VIAAATQFWSIPNERAATMLDTQTIQAST